MTKTARRLTRLLVPGALAAAMSPLTPPARAADTAPTLPAVQFGMHGAIHGELVRLNISNTAPPDPSAPPDPCHATLALVDAKGEVLRRPDGTPLSRDVTVPAGRSAALQVHAGALLGPDDIRLDFRPVVLVDAPPDPAAPPDPCIPTLEIIVAATGQTRLLDTGASRVGWKTPNETLAQDR